MPKGASRWLFLLLAAASPLLLLYSAEARAYGLLALLSFALFLLTARAGTDTRHAVAIAVLTAAALYTHSLAIFTVGALLFLALAAGRRRQAAALLAGGALFLPWVPILLSQPGVALSWSQERPGPSLAGFLSALGGAGRVPAPFGPPLPPPVPALGIALALLLLALLVPRCRRDAILRGAVLFVLLVLSAILLASLWRPLAFAGRSEMTVLPVWLWALARAGEESRPVRWAGLAAVFLGAAASASLLMTPRPVPAPLAATERLAGIAREGDSVLAGAGFYLPARLASERGRLRAAVRAFPAAIAEHPGWFAPVAPREEDYAAVANALERAAPGSRVFLLLPSSYRTGRLEGLLAAKGTVREAVRSPEGVLLVWSPLRAER